MSALVSNSHIICSGRDLHHRELQIPTASCRFSGFGVIELRRGLCRWRNLGQSRGEEVNGNLGGAIRSSSTSWFNLSGSSEAMEMEPIKDCEQLDQILEEAREKSQPILIDWMAGWCRKCIYLKPKLDRMAADYVSKIRFYCVDVNKVPQALVKRGNISKMPTIQIWKDGEMKAEVIGGHKAWLVVDEVKEMVQKFI